MTRAAVLAALFLFVSTTSAASQSAPTLAVPMCPTLEAQPSQRVCVPVNLLAHGAAVASAGFTLTYDPAVLRLPGGLQDVQAGAALTGGQMLNAQVTENPGTGIGRVQVTITAPIQPTTPIIPDGVVCEVCFTIEPTAPNGCTDIQFLANSVEMGDDNGQDLQVDPPVSGGLQITSGATPAPTVTVTATTTPPGGETATPLPTATPTLTETATPAASATGTSTPVPTRTVTPTPIMTVTPTPTPAAKNNCDAGKMQCVAKTQACFLHVHSRAEKKGEPVDSAALQKCSDKLVSAKGCIGKLEDKQDRAKPTTLCSVTGDVGTLESKVDAFVDDVVSEIDPAFPAVQSPNTCNAGKKACVGAKVGCLIKVHQNAVKKGESADGAALQKCSDKFDNGTEGCIGKLETKQDPKKPKTLCSVTGDGGALESKVDAFVTDVVSEIRNAP